jgi:hypothetical protein
MSHFLLSDVASRTQIMSSLVFILIGHINEIYRLNGRGKKFKKFKIFSLLPISIHVTNSGNILVGVVESVGG